MVIFKIECFVCFSVFTCSHVKYILFQLRLKNLIKQNLIKTENRIKNIKEFQKI